MPSPALPLIWHLTRSSGLVAASSAGPTAAANVLDRRRVYIPLVALTGGTTAMGAYGSYQLNKAAGATINTSEAIELVVCLVIGALAVFAAVSGSRPLLRKVTADPAQSAD